MKGLDFAWAIDGYDQYKDEVGTWEVTFNHQVSESIQSLLKYSPKRNVSCKGRT